MCTALQEPVPHEIAYGRQALPKLSGLLAQLQEVQQQLRCLRVLLPLLGAQVGLLARLHSCSHCWQCAASYLVPCRRCGCTWEVAQHRILQLNQRAAPFPGAPCADGQAAGHHGGAGCPSDLRT